MREARTTRSFLSGYLTKDDLEKIKGAIARAEKRTSGEIRVRIIRLCDADLGGDVMAQAKRDFYREKLYKTRDHTGVLVLLALGENKFAVLADKGIYSKISQDELNNLVFEMSREFRAGHFRQGVLRAVKALGDKLAEHFPRKPDDVNELPDEVEVGGGR